MPMDDLDELDDQAEESPAPSALADLGELAESPDVADMEPDVRRAFYTYFQSNSRTKTGRRSLNQVAELLELPIGTVRAWHTRYHWSSLAASLDKTADSESMQAAMVAAAVSRPRIVAELQAIAFSTAVEKATGKPIVSVRDRLYALAQLRELTGLSRLPGVASPTDEEEERFAGYSDADLQRMAASGKPEDMAELMRLATGRAPSPAAS